MKVITVQVGSYIHDSTQIWFTGSFGHDIENQRAQQYELTAKELEINDTFIIHANRCDTQHSAPLTKSESRIVVGISLNSVEYLSFSFWESDVKFFLLLGSEN